MEEVSHVVPMDVDINIFTVPDKQLIRELVTNVGLDITKATNIYKIIFREKQNNSHQVSRKELTHNLTESESYLVQDYYYIPLKLESNNDDNDTKSIQNPIAKSLNDKSISSKASDIKKLEMEHKKHKQIEKIKRMGLLFDKFKSFD